jgi:hypothetical protein
MHNRRRTLWTTLVLIAVLVLSGCAPRSGTGPAETAIENSKQLVVDLPAIVIDIDEDGVASVGNVPVARWASLFGADISTLSVPPSWIEFLVSGNIQHIQVNNTASGLLLLVNGQAIPSLSYTDGSLQATAEVLSSLGMAVPMLDKLLPVVEQVGVGMIARFPVAEGQAAIPLYMEGDGTAAAVARQAQQEFLASVETPLRINLPVFYRPDGSWTVGNLTDTELTTLTGMPFYALRLNPTVLRGLANSGVDSLSISTNPAGIQISINGKTLPTLTWGDGELQHLMGLADQLGVFDRVAPGMNMGEVLATTHQLMPLITATDFDLTVHMPGMGLATRR